MVGFVLGLTALVLLIVSIGILSPLTLVLGSAGFVFGLLGKRRVDRGATARGHGLGIAGLVLGLVAAVLSLIVVVLFTIGLMSGGSGDSRDIDGAEATVKEYLSALVEGEGDDACEILEAGPRRQLASGPGSRQFGTTGSCEDFVEAQAGAIDRSPGGSIVYDGARLSDSSDIDDLELRTSIDLTGVSRRFGAPAGASRSGYATTRTTAGGSSSCRRAERPSTSLIHHSSPPGGGGGRRLHEGKAPRSHRLPPRLAEPVLECPLDRCVERV